MVEAFILYLTQNNFDVYCFILEMFCAEMCATMKSVTSGEPEDVTCFGFWGDQKLKHSETASLNLTAGGSDGS